MKKFFIIGGITLVVAAVLINPVKKTVTSESQDSLKCCIDSLKCNLDSCKYKLDSLCVDSNHIVVPKDTIKIDSCTSI